MRSPPGVSIVSCTASPEDGDHTLRITYRRDHAPGTFGLRVDTRSRPPVGGDEEDLAEGFAGWLLTVEVAEPRGSRNDELWTDAEATVWRDYR